MTTENERILQLADTLFFTFMDHLHAPEAKEFIEIDPDNEYSRDEKGGTRSTDRGMALYDDIKQELCHEMESK